MNLQIDKIVSSKKKIFFSKLPKKLEQFFSYKCNFFQFIEFPWIFTFFFFQKNPDFPVIFFWILWIFPLIFRFFKIARYKGPLRLIRRLQEEILTTSVDDQPESVRRATNRINWLLKAVIKQRHPELIQGLEPQVWESWILWK